MHRPTISKALKLRVAQRAKFCCEYCRSQEQYSPDPFSIEHIIPRAKAGSDDFSNLAFACQGCNNYKHISIQAYDSVTQAMVPLYHPRKDVWSKQFAWNENFSELIGIRASGRVTIEKLKLNRLGLINLRKVLHAVGKHPPSF